MNMGGILIPIVMIIICFWIDRRLGIGITAAMCVYLVYANVPNFYASKGNKALAARDDENALKWYKKAYDTGRASVMVRASYAFVMMRGGMFEEAEALLSSMLAQKHIDEPKRNMIRQYRSMALFKMGRREEAVEEAEEIFEQYKNSAMYGIIGYFKLTSDELTPEEKRAFCEEAYEYNSDDRDITDNLAASCILCGDYESALEYAEKLIDKNPKFVEAYYHGAQAAYALGDKETAAEYLDMIEDCMRSAMTTVSEEDIRALREKCGE